jgi:zinc transport system substrate-binding protein
LSAIGRAAAIAAALALVGCEQSPPPPAASPVPPLARPLVVASFFPLYDFSRQVAGDRATVISLVPLGVEPHDWEPSPRDVVEVQRARLFVYNGGGFEQMADRLLKEIAGKGPLAVNTTEGIALLDAKAAGHDHRHDKAKDHGKDPHVWLDPLLAQRQVDAIAAGLAQVDAAGKAAYEANATAYKARLAALHDAFEKGLKDCVRRDVVTSHAAFAYLARRYRLNQVPVMGLAPEAEPNPQDLARLVRFARAKKVEYIFFETLVSPKLAETLAREVGAKTLVLDPVEGLGKDDAAAGKDYIGLMQGNLDNLRTALECR